MSTSAVVVFDGTLRKDVAAVCVVHDGDPAKMLARLRAFFADLEAQRPQVTTAGDPEKLAAQYVVWEAQRNTPDPGRPLLFLEVVVCVPGFDPGGYKYRVICEAGNEPAIRLVNADGSEWR